MFFQEFFAVFTNDLETSTRAASQSVSLYVNENAIYNAYVGS